MNLYHIDQNVIEVTVEGPPGARYDFLHDAHDASASKVSSGVLEGEAPFMFYITWGSALVVRPYTEEAGDDGIKRHWDGASVNTVTNMTDNGYPAKWYMHRQHSQEFTV